MSDGDLNKLGVLGNYWMEIQITAKFALDEEMSDMPVLVAS
jgi:hypothetical protein